MTLIHSWRRFTTSASASASAQTRKFVRNCRRISTQLTLGRPTLRVLLEIDGSRLAHCLLFLGPPIPRTLSRDSLGFPLSIFLDLVPLGFVVGSDENATANNVSQTNRLRGGYSAG